MVNIQEYGIVHARMKVREEQNLQTPVRFRAPQQDSKTVLATRAVLVFSRTGYYLFIIL